MTGPDLRERRRLTVLFSDLKGFTALSETRDAEEVSDLVDALFRRFRAEIERQGGTIDKFIGDAVMAVFGAPVAHEDDALRAVRAGLAMQRSLAAFNTERGLALEMRVGINSGEALWGGVGGEKATAMGDAVNLAQRMESAARPGTVLASGSVASQTGDRISFRAVGAIAVKGRAEPVEAFEAVEEISARTEYRLSGGLATRMVGRDGELARLETLVGSGRFALVVGDAGIGKSRLLAELRRKMRPRQIKVAVGRALQGQPFPLGPFAEVVREGSGASGLGAADAARAVEWIRASFEKSAAPPPQAERWAQLMAVSAGWPLLDPAAAQGDARRSQAETFEAWEQWLRGLSAAGPVLLCLEDLHWADDATRELLESIAGRLAGGNLSVIATARPAMVPLKGFERVDLAELDGEAASRLAAEAIGRDVTPGLASFLQEQSGGHPYYLQELARHLVAAGAVEGSPAALGARPPALPDSLHGLLVARLDALDPGVKEVLKAASVLGRVFWLGLLSRLAGAGDTEAAVAQARSRELVVSQHGSILPGDTEMAFRHALLRDAAYSLLTNREKSRLHEAAAERFESDFPDRPSALLAIAARHREAASQPPAAARLWSEAASRAVEETSWDASLSYAREAIRCGATVEPRLAAAKTLYRLGRYAESREEAVAAAAFKDVDAETAWRVRHAIVAVDGRLASAESYVAMLEDLLAGAPPGFPRAHSLLSLAMTRLSLNDVSRAAKEIEEALPAAREIFAGSSSPESRHLLLNTFLGLATIRGACGDEAGAEAALAEAQKFASSRQSPLWTSQIHRARALRHHAKGEVESGIGEEMEAVKILRRVGDRESLALALLALGEGQLRRGCDELAMDPWCEALAIYRKMEVPTGVSYLLCLLADVQARQGDLAAVRESLGEAERVQRPLGDTMLLFNAVIAGTEAALDLGEMEAGRRGVEETRRIGKVVGSPSAEAHALLMQARWQQATGAAGDAARSRAEALELSRPDIPEIACCASMALARAFLPRDSASAAAHAALAVELAGQPAARSAHLGPSLALRGLIAALRGNREASREDLRAAGECPPHAPSFSQLVTFRAERAAALRELGDPSAAHEFQEIGNVLARARALGTRAEIAWMLQD